jgi:hypothetical protein
MGVFVTVLYEKYELYGIICHVPLLPFKKLRHTKKKLYPCSSNTVHQARCGGSHL